jgi:hypothetical protein
MARPTTILALVQTLVVVVGFIGLGVVLKVCGYPNGELMGVRWTPLALFLREHLGFLLLIPVMWVFYASTAERKDCGWLSYRIAFIIGLAIAACMLSAFLYASCYPFTRPIWFGVR